VPGQFVNIRLLLQVRRHALTVPLTAVVRGPEGAYAFLVGADRVVPIKVGLADKMVAIIDSRLAAGDRVVTDGHIGSKPEAASRS
jgi:multidrug efflux system membrane fusion protein